MVAIIASFSAALLGTLAAFNLFRYRFFGRNFMHALIFSMILVPDIVLAVAFIIFYKLVSIPLGFFTLVMAHITFCMPFVSVIVYGRLSGSDMMIFEAAKDLGAGDMTVFLKITIPLMLPAIIAGMLLSFTLSIDDVIISYFVTGPTFQILPLTIYSMVRVGVTPEINALCTVTLLTTFTAAGIAQLLIRKQNNKRARK
jgi:spermidine/putrescine transport system permease protein